MSYKHHWGRRGIGGSTNQYHYCIFKASCTKPTFKYCREQNRTLTCFGICMGSTPLSRFLGFFYSLFLLPISPCINLPYIWWLRLTFRKAVFSLSASLGDIWYILYIFSQIYLWEIINIGSSLPIGSNPNFIFGFE